MKKVFLLGAMALLVACTGNKQNESATSAEADTAAETEEVVIEDSDELVPVDDLDAEEFAAAQEFIANLVNDLDIDDEWIASHCSPAVIQRLKDDNPYEGDGLATWELKGLIFDSEEMNMEAQVVGFGYGLLHGTPVYSLEKMYQKDEVRAFATTYYGLERQGEDFCITYFDCKAPASEE